MLTDHEIQHLVQSSKTIVTKIPSKGYKQEGGYNRCQLTLRTTPLEENSEEFSIFIRQAVEFIENYSIGLRYKTNNKTLGTITLVRYNGPHGEISRTKDGHFSHPHIHRLTAAEIKLGSTEPQEKHRELTDRYSTLESAIEIFFEDICVDNYVNYFPETIQIGLFDEH